METNYPLPPEFALIGLCLAPKDEARLARIAQAAREIPNWENLWQLVCDRHVAPLVYVRLHAAGVEELIPSATRERLRWLYLQTAAMNTLRLHQTLQISSRLAERGIKTLYLKGGSLVMAEDYPNAGHRMFSDVDILVEEKYKEEVRRTFIEAGDWRELPPINPREWKQTQWMNSWQTLFEVHWRLKSYNGVPSEVSERRLWSRALEIDYHGHRALIPSLEDRFLLTAIHGTAHHSFDTSLLFMALSDLAHLAAGKNGPPNWDRTAEVLCRERMLEHVVVVTELATILTQLEPLAQGLALLHRAEPKADAITAPLVQPLLRMVCKPWVFASMPETKFLTDKRWRERARVLGEALSAKLLPGWMKKAPVPDQESEVRTINLKARYQRKLLDPDFLSYLFQLSRFYRRIGYTAMD